jgi:glycosyltransferase involved in cell wall biosynthesis
MRVAQFTSTFLPRVGGTEVVVHNLVTELLGRGVECHVVTWWGLWKECHRQLPYPVHPLPPKCIETWLAFRRQPWIADWLAWPLLARLQRKYRFDLWHVHMGYPAATFAVPALRRLGLPCVVTCHGGDVQTLAEIGFGHRLDPVLDPLICRAVGMADRVTAISQTMVDVYREMGISQERIDLVPNGVNVARVRQHRIDREAVRRELGIPPGAKMILSVGRNDRRKGFAVIPPALKSVLARHPDVVWVLVGRETESIAPIAVREGVADRLKILNRVTLLDEPGEPDYVTPSKALMSLLKAADLFVCPSIVEGFGIVLIEAMAAGLPIVTSDGPGCRDVVRHEQSGLLVPPNRPDLLAAALNRLLADPALAERLAAGGSRQSEEYAWDKVAAAYLASYARVG